MTSRCPRIYAGPEVNGAITGAALRFLGRYNDSCNLIIALGDVAESRSIVRAAEVKALRSSDAFIVRSKRLASGVFQVACVGRSVRATGFALFEVFQQFGFAFLHPLNVVMPSSLPSPLPDLNLREEPRWEFRGTHYHTQHPLELTPVLNGYDSDGGHDDRVKWEASLPGWRKFLDWMLAQKQNYVEWLILGDRQESAASKDNFELSSERKHRFTQLIALAHERGLEVGADVPLVQQQQHALALLPDVSSSLEEDAVRIRSVVRWFIDCGFDHLGTEMGATEFSTGVSAQNQIYILNVVKEEIGPTRRLLVKHHCSTKQRVDGLPDPRPGHDGENINFNYISYYANPTIVAMPHTVQIYSLRDPAPTYGNVDFSDLRNWTRYLLQVGRPVVFYPETAYWVNYDSGVPLFLAPVYTKSRVEDALDLDSMSGPRPVLGQLNFESGWQWGYWLANSAQAAVAWQKLPDTTAVFDKMFRFVSAQVREPLVALLVDCADAQHSLLIKGIQDAPHLPGIGGGALTGIVYVMGSEGLSDLASLAARFLNEGAPQPDRLHFHDLWDSAPLAVVGWWPWRRHPEVARRQWYREHLRPLLSRMNSTFGSLARRFESLSPAPSVAEGSFRDLATTAKMLSLRCDQVLALYDHSVDCEPDAWSEVAAFFGHKDQSRTAWCDARLNDARDALQSGKSLVREREAWYGIADDASARQVFGWRPPNPTAYNFGYLWPVHHLFYWQRDQAIVEARVRNPCFASINDPIELGLRGGGGRFVRGSRSVLQTILINRLWKFGLGDCLNVPEAAPEPLAMVSDETSYGSSRRHTFVLASLAFLCVLFFVSERARSWVPLHVRLLGSRLCAFFICPCSARWCFSFSALGRVSYRNSDKRSA
eukprot:TRINITY_DN48772_c0_g1_i1.p1 TRINITY_DN48772_c0_g1~~TRINITY_DN48772_c0_g1_i1.p1  ORF type:complete len:920 (+),score=96.32 TRINITY_DN48772_c0_g1_i1:123-2762(+)